jgi:putative transposase
MTRANRCILPGTICHITHRCHDHEFLLRFGIDRTEYCRRLRIAVRRHRVSLLDYCITCNHTHLLAASNAPDDISRMMQQLEGEFAAYYNRRKEITGGFWDDRFHGTMVEDGVHLQNCLRYIDLNMVRAGAVSHPRDWNWGGYQELLGQRKRFRLLDLDRLLALLEMANAAEFMKFHDDRIAFALDRKLLRREPHWSEAIAVGSKPYVEDIAARLNRRKRLSVESAVDGAWCVRECLETYDTKNRGKNRL